ncbi:MAG: hypothetical protein QOG46_2681, partial [Pseudonocardiales bacterium]|nr:hypothetical protein [Pseudonocardiales bacterium]
DGVLVASNTRSASPRSKVIARIVPEPVPQLCTLYDDCFKVTVLAVPELGLNETDV